MKLAPNAATGEPMLTMTPIKGETPWLWTVRTLANGTWTSEVLPGWVRSHRLAPSTVDEVIVTVFTAGSAETLPIWIFANLARPNELPVINVVALVVIVISIIPVWAAQKLAGPIEGDEAKALGVAEG